MSNIGEKNPLLFNGEEKVEVKETCQSPDAKTANDDDTKEVDEDEDTSPEQVEIINEAPQSRCHPSRCKPDRYMLPAKLCYFFQMAKDSAYQPYLLLFLIGIGLSPGEAALINGVRLVGMIAGSIFWGQMSDRKQNHKQILFILCIAGILLMEAQPLIAIAVGDPDRNVCPSPMSETEGSKVPKIGASFWVLLFLNIVASFFDGCTLSFVDSGVIQRINVSETPKDFGFNRLFGAFGFSIGSLLSSLTIKNFPAGETNCYTGIFIMHFILTMGLLLSSAFLYRGANMNIPKAERKKNVGRSVCKTICQTDNMFFIITLLIMGMMQSVFLSFTSLQLKNLNAPTILLGLTTMVAAISTGPATARSTKLIGLFGTTWRCMIFCCFTYFIRYIAFAYIENPWYALPISILQSFGLGLFIIAAVHHVKAISTPQVYTTMYGLANSMHFGVGYILSNIIYGQIYKYFGGKTMFIAAGSTAGVWTAILVVYKIIQRSRESEDVKRKESFQETEEESRSARDESFINNY